MKSQEKLVLAQIGCGYWGPNLLRNFSALPNVHMKYLSDLDSERRRFVERSFPATKAVENPDAIWEDPEVSAVVIATPANTHFELAREALEHGKHVFVEKPLATKVSEVADLSRIAATRDLTVMAGHTFLYNSAVRYVKQMIDRGDLGEIRYIYSQRLNLGRIRSDVDALWNFAPHDISIIQFWLGDPKPVSVTRVGMDYVQAGIEDVVFLNIIYPNKVLAHIHVSWLDPHKTRKMVVVGTRRMVVYDDVSEDKIIVYDKGIDRRAKLGENMDFDKPGAYGFDYRAGDVVMPRIDWIEPLRAEAEHFVECVRERKMPLSGTAHAYRVIEVLEQAERLRVQR